MRALGLFAVYLILICSAHATPVVYTLAGDTQTTNGHPSGLTFVAKILVDTGVVGRNYAGGVEQDLSGTYFAGLISYVDNQGNSLDLPAGSNTFDGKYSIKELRSGGLFGYTTANLSSDGLFDLEILSNWELDEWAVGQYMEFNTYSSTYPQAGSHFANITAIESVPIPATLSLLASAIFGIVGLRRARI